MVLFTKHHLTFMSSETISENKLTSIASLKASNDVDLVRSYLRDIGRVPLLSHEQEITLGRQVQEYMQVERAELEIIELTGDKPSQRKNSKEAFRGFINLFDDYLATDLFDKVNSPIQLIWGEDDPWESLNEAREWKKQFRIIKRLDIINGAGHCPHDEEPELTNKLINEFIQETK